MAYKFQALKSVPGKAAINGWLLTIFNGSLIDLMKSMRLF